MKIIPMLSDACGLGRRFNQRLRDLITRHENCTLDGAIDCAGYKLYRFRVKTFHAGARAPV